jgi:hypothetical protein
LILLIDADTWINYLLIGDVRAATQEVRDTHFADAASAAHLGSSETEMATGTVNGNIGGP